MFVAVDVRCIVGQIATTDIQFSAEDQSSPLAVAQNRQETASALAA